MTFSPSASQEEKIEHYRAIIRRYITAVNGKDIEAILALFADDAEVHDPIFQRSFLGRDAIRPFYEGVITRAQLEIVGPIRGSFGNVAAAPVLAKIPGSEIDVITLTSFDEQGLIKHYAAYWGPTDVRQIGA